MLVSIRRGIRSPSQALSATLVLVVVLGCSGGEPEQQTRAVRPAKLIEVGVATDVRTVSFPAIIEAATTVDLSFQVAGLLTDVPVRTGQEIEKGAVIARLDQRDFRNDLATAEAELVQAEAAFKRAEVLVADFAISRREFDESRARLDIARASHDTARKRLEDTTLRSPFAGVVASKEVVRSENVSPQETIVTIQAYEAAEATVQIPASIVAEAKRFEVEEEVVVLDAAPELRIPAVIQSVSTQADPQTQTFRVKFAFTPPNDLIVLPGMTGTVESRMRVLHVDGSAAVPKIPVSAILSDGEVTYVWVVERTTMTVSRREVTVAPGVGEALSILEGLSPGETIVGAGASYLHEGMKITPYES